MAKIVRIIAAGVIGAATGGIILFISPFIIGFGAFRHSFMSLGSENWGHLQYLLIISICAVGGYFINIRVVKSEFKHVPAV